MGKVSILGVGFDAVTKQQAIDWAMDRIRRGEKGYVVTPNSEIVYAAKSDPELKELLNDAALSLPDGVGILHAAKILGKPIYEKVAGVEFGAELIAAMAKENRSVYLFGAKPGVAKKAAQNLLRKNPGLKLAGCRDGYFDDENAVVEQIKKAGHIDLILVCLGMGKQEKFIRDHFDEIDATLFAGLGGSMDIYAGTAERAPDFYVDHGLEWFYRLKKEPWRAKRMTSLPKFLGEAVKAKVTGKE